MYNRGASYDGEAQHSYQRLPRGRQQFYGNAVCIGERKLSSAWPPRKCTSDFQVYKSRYPELDHLFSAKQILDGIIDNCKRSVIYALIADESTDVTNKEQISVCIRFVSTKEDGKHFIHEEFLTFVHADKGTNAEELTTKFLETIQSVGLLVNDIRAQGYDGASVMSGHVSGVQTRIRQVNPNAVYVHCRPHVLNLCIVHVSKLPLVRNIMDTMQEVTWPLSSLQNVCWYLRNNLETIMLLEKKWEDAQSWSCFVKRAGPPEQIACQFSLTLSRYYLIFIIWIIAHLLWAKNNGTFFLIHQCSFLGYNRHIRPAKRGRRLQGQSPPCVCSEMGLHYYSCCAPAHFWIY